MFSTIAEYVGKVFCVLDLWIPPPLFVVNCLCLTV